MPLSTYLNLGLGELAHTKLKVELVDMTEKYLKGIAENVLVGIGKFVFLVDFIILDMPEDIKVPLILGRPFLSIACAKIDVYKRKITLRVGEERIIFTSVKPASRETLVLNRSLDPLFEDYIELNDLNEPFELRRNQGDDLMPTIEEGELKIDNPNITMEEYIRLQEEKALSRGETFNWQTATYDLLTEPTISPQHIDEFDLKDETSLFEYTDNNNKIDIERPSGDMSITPIPDVINVNVQGSNKLLETIILNGNKVLKRTVREVEKEYEPNSAEEKQDRRNEMKAKGTLLIALPNKDQLKFHSYKDAKFLMESLEKRYKGNKESKKVQKTLLKQQYKNFKGSSEVIAQEDMNLKLLRSLPFEWKTHALIWRNKEEIETIGLDYLYNNFKIYEPELTGSTNTNQNSQNVAFVSSNSTNSNSNNSTNEADNTTYGVSAAHTQSNPTSGDNLSDVVICAFLASQPNSPQLTREDLEQIDPDDLQEMDLQ
ncbi:ribonuclease H-like domain-containing protein [Tanacetum coccineum]